MKPTSEDFRAYMNWQRYILGCDVEIPKDCRRPTLIAFCLTLAIHGSAGRECYASDARIATELGIARRHLAKYRRLAVELGWFKTNGRTVNRVESLDIAIPAFQLNISTPDSGYADWTPPAPKPAPQPKDESPSADDPWLNDPWVDDQDAAALGCYVRRTTH